MKYLSILPVVALAACSYAPEVETEVPQLYEAVPEGAELHVARSNLRALGLQDWDYSGPYQCGDAPEDDLNTTLAHSWCDDEAVGIRLITGGDTEDDISCMGMHYGWRDWVGERVVCFSSDDAGQVNWRQVYWFSNGF